MFLISRSLFILGLIVGFSQPIPAFAQTAGCQFILGFQTLHDLAPPDVGDCLDNQSFAPNGDAQQHTNKGLMAWRKADNWTAFTNGYQTWINGPDGLVVRLNTERFPWEGPDAPTSAATPAGSVGAAPSGVAVADSTTSPSQIPAPVVPGDSSSSSPASSEPLLCRDGTVFESKGDCRSHGGAI